jgi:L,D-peptidoglycan transpeptidase YkuD (ErfK/YbiS/YcfS/YnhG family)
VKYFLILINLVTFFSTAPAGKYPMGSIADEISILQTGQLLIVITAGWDSVQGTLYAFEKEKGKWKLQFSNAVVVGSKGMAIGDGAVKLSIDSAPVKKEGDKKSPAGIFTLGSAFGYAENKNVGWIKDHYVQADDTLICVDDPHSAQYNKLVKIDSSARDWTSFEQMHRKDNFYKWGLFVDHNSANVVKGDGSCIFLHIWQNDHEGTDGCTAMKEENMVRILKWINAKANPMFIQMPRDAYRNLSATYELPKIELQ